MSAPLIEVAPTTTPEPPEPRRWTERDMLDALNARYLRPIPGRPVRYVVAEHVRPGGGVMKPPAVYRSPVSGLWFHDCDRCGHLQACPGQGLQ